MIKRTAAFQENGPVEWRALSCPIVLLLLLLLVVVNGRRPETVDKEMDGRNDGFLLVGDNVFEREHRLVNIDGDDDSDGIIRTDFPPSILNEEHRRGSREDISFLSPNKIEPLLSQTLK
jgi:hypothetical protein